VSGGFVFRRRITVEWGNCDPMRIVFYPNYFTWFDEQTLAMFADRGLPLAKIQQELGLLGLPLVDARASFRSPASFGDTLEAETAVAEWGRTSFRVRHLFAKDGRSVVEGEETRIWAGPDPADPTRIRPTAIPDVVKARFA
jgi:4-hydroxybenzoyl-CoA thioesterase